MEQAATARLPLTVEERAGKADSMARLVKRIEGVKAEAKERAAEFREEIDGLMAELDAIASVVQDGAEERTQMDLTFIQDEAVRALAAVGTVACTCIDAEIKAIECPVHGVETAKRPSSQEVLEAAGVVDAEGNATESFLGDPEAAAVEKLASDLEAAGVVPEVETIAPETPPVMDEFIKAQKSRRRRRAEA